MTIIQSRDLEARGLLHDQSSALLIQGRWYKPGPAFTKSLLQAALEFCEVACLQGRQYLLIEFPTYFMAWRRFRPKASVQAQTAPDAQVPQPIAKTANTSASDTRPAELSVNQIPETIDRAFIRRCQSELAIHIGPIADVLTEQTLKQSEPFSPQQLIESLALHIPDPKAALAFRRALQLP